MSDSMTNTLGTIFESSACWEGAEDEIKESYVEILRREYQKIDVTAIAHLVMEQKTVEAYATALNMRAEYEGTGYGFQSPEILEIGKIEQFCERLIAMDVLRKNGWKETKVSKYHKEKGKRNDGESNHD